MKSFTKKKRYDMIDAFNSTSTYLDDLFNIDNIHLVGCSLMIVFGWTLRGLTNSFL